MAGVTVQAIAQDFRSLETDALIVGCFEDVRPLRGVSGRLDWLLCGALSSLLQTTRVRGAMGDVALLTARGKLPAKKIFMVGMGRRTEQSAETVRENARLIASSALNAGAFRVAWEYVSNDTLPQDIHLSVLVDGLHQGAAGRDLHLSLLIPDAEACRSAARHLPAVLPDDQPAGDAARPAPRRFP